MAQDYRFDVTSLADARSFSWVFLVDWLMFIAVTLFVGFYMGRLIAWLFSQALGWYLWRKHSIYFKVGSFNVSVLAGRIFFKNVVYIGENEAFSILQGHFTWRYWLPHTRKSEIEIQEQPPGEGLTSEKNAKLPTRLKLLFQGFEWFVYNRSEAYEVLAENIKLGRKTSVNTMFTGSDTVAPSSEESPKAPAAAQSTAASIPRDLGDIKVPGVQGLAEPHRGIGFAKELTFFEQKMKSVLPVKVTFLNAAVIAGSPHTQSILVGRTKHASALMDMGKASNEHDRYLARYLLKADKPEFELLPNYDYVGAENEIATKSSSKRLKERLIRWSQLLRRSKKPKTWKESWIAMARSSSKLDTRKTEEAHVKEYAKIGRILWCQDMEVDYYYDMLGPQPALTEKDGIPLPVVDPVFGVDIKLREATVNYGPWAERQRVELFSVFFPRSCVDSLPRVELSEGQMRQYTQTKLFIHFDGPSVIRCPVREPSKDIVFTHVDPDLTRSFGWLEITAASGSSAAYTMGLLPDRSNKWLTNAVLAFKSPVITTSVNHGMFLDAQSYTVTLDTEQPLQWNGHQKWKLHNEVEQLRIFLLREHVTLINDTITDFGSGPAVPYTMFTPATYDITWNAPKFSLYFNVNSQNIINNPTSLEENIFLILNACDVNIRAHVPLDQVALVDNTVDFNIFTPELRLDLNAPSWHTMNGALDSTTLGCVENFVFGQSIHYYSDATLKKPETHKLEIGGENFVLLCYGFLIDYLMTWSDNYFGHKYRFQTTEEYLHVEASGPAQEVYAFSRIDPDLDAIIQCEVQNACFVLPQNLYSSSENITLQVDDFAAQARFTNFYMDLQAQFSPVHGHVNHDVPFRHIFDVARLTASPVEIFISMVNVQGHRMFGLPPSEPTYNCKWDFDISDVVVDTDIKIFDYLEWIATRGAHSHSDIENKPVVPPVLLFDVTFVSARIDSLSLKVNVDEGSWWLLETSSIKFTYNDLANEHYSEKVFFAIPRIDVSAARKNTTVLQGTTDVKATIYINKPNAAEHFKAQQEHIMLHDALFHRCPFFLDDDHRNSDTYRARYRRHSAGYIEPTLPLPPTAGQITRETAVILEPRMNIVEPLGRHQGPGVAGTLRSTVPSDVSLLSNESEQTPLDQYNDIEMGDESPSARERHAEPLMNNAYLPPNSWRTNSGAKPNLGSATLNALPWSLHAPYLPIEEEDREYITLVVELGTVRVKAEASAIPLVTGTMMALESYNLGAAMDGVEVDLIERLAGAKLKSCKRVHVVVPKVEVQFGLREPSLQPDTLDFKSDHLFATLSNLTFMHQASETPSTISDKGILTREVTIKELQNGRLEFESIVVGSRRGDVQDATKATPLMIDATKAAFWWELDPEAKSVISETSFGNMDAFIVADQVPWLFKYFESLIRAVPDGLMPDQRLSKEELAAATILEIAEAGGRLGIDDDSYVLTRPTGAVQSSDHVRSSISWRIAVRLRQLYQRVPPKVRKDVERKIASPGYQLPEDPLARIRKLFKKWRKWEHEGIENARIFEILGKKPSHRESVLVKALFARVQSLALRVSYSNLQEDFVILDNPLFRFSLKIYQKQSRRFHLSSMIERVRLHLSQNIFGLLTQVQALLKERRVPTPNANGKRARSNSTLSRRLKDDDAVQGMLLVMVTDFSAVLELQSLALELHNRSLRLSSAIEYQARPVESSFFSTGVLVSRTAAVRISETGTSKELGDYLAENMSVGFASKGLPSEGTVWVNIELETLALAVTATVEHLAEVAVKFIQEDVPVITAAFPQERRVPSSDVSTDSEITNEGNFSVDLNVGSATFKVQPVSMLLLSLSGYNLQAQLRKPDARGILISAEMDNQVLTASYEEHARLGTFVTEGFTILSRIDRVDNAGDIRVVLKRIKLGTASLFRILEYARSPELVKQFQNTRRALDRLLDVRAKSIPDEVRHQVGPPPPTFLINFNLIVEETLVTLPLDNSAFHFVMTALETKHESFTWNGDAEFANPAARLVSVTPQSTSGNFTDFEITFSQDNKVNRVLALQVTASHSQQRAEQSFHVTSDYAHIWLNPYVAGAVSMAIAKLDAYRQDLFGDAELGTTKVKNVSETATQPSVPVQEAAGAVATGTLLNIKAAVSLSKFTFVWHTGNENLTQEGLSLGYDLMQINLAQGRARVVVDSFFIAPADVAERTEDLQKQLNTAFMPHLELIGVLSKIDEQKLVYMQLRGESLKINLTPAIAQILAGLVSSFDLTQDLIANLPTRSSAQKRASADRVFAQKPKFTHGISLHVETHFDSASLLLWEDPEMFGSRLAVSGEEPSLELYSPAVNFTTEYLYSEGERDSVLLRMVVSKSSNIVYPRALVEVKNIIRNTGDIVRDRRRASLPRNVVPGRATAKTSIPSPEFPVTADHFHKLLTYVDFNVRVHFESQELSLSSMPYSKIVATAYTSGIDLLLTTPIGLDGSYSVSLSGLMNESRVSLQHMYSRESSGFIRMKSIALTGLHFVTGKPQESPLRIGLKLNQPEFEVRASQLYDVGLFRDIWLDDGSSSALVWSREQTPEIILEDVRETFAARYRRAVETLPMPISLNFTLQNMHGTVDLGQSVGRGTLDVDRVWAASFKTADYEQFFGAGIDAAKAVFEGRVGGQVDLRNYRARVTLSLSEARNMPFIQATSELEYLTFYLSLDFHPFLAAVVKGFNIGISNQQERLSSPTHKLLSTLEFEEFWVIGTSLMAGHMMDVAKLGETIDVRAMAHMRSDVTRSRRSQQHKPGKIDLEEVTVQQIREAAHEIVTRLHVFCSIHIGKVFLFIFPTEFSDSVAMRAAASEIQIKFGQSREDMTLDSEIAIAMSRFNLGISTIRHQSDNLITSLATEQFIRTIEQSGSGSTIVNIPHFTVEMTTSDQGPSRGKIVEFVFRSSFDGSVEVGWNLGAINFIREMIESHKRAVNTRQLIRTRSQVGDSGTVRSASTKEDKPEYVPLEKPIIVIPQLHDMGDATPPVEWIGLNRQNLPNAVHWYGVRPLNELVTDLEKVYERLLGRS